MHFSTVRLVLDKPTRASTLSRDLCLGPNPPPMQFMLPEKALPESAEVAVIMGLHQVSGGAIWTIFLDKIVCRTIQVGVFVPPFEMFACL